MKNLKYDLAMAAATSQTTADLIKNPQLKTSSAIAANFVVAYKSLETESGKKNLQTAADILKHFN